MENKNNKWKFYDLMMFPYPSGTAMHVGHASNYLYSEIIARFRRMQGYDVIFPLGYDSFGLPTENFAIKNNVSAQEATDNNIKYFEEQVAAMNFSLDKDRMLRTSDPEYYKWTQWIFEKLFEHGLVYRKDGFVNRDPVDQTVLANDQVLPDGTAERSGAVVVQKRMSQWYIKITAFAEQLLDYSDCDRPEETITHQKNWIGRSEWAEIDFDIYIWDKGDNLTSKVITVFTTRPDTIYGVTAIVIAPENEILDIYMSEDKKAELAEYRRVTSLKTNIERQSTDKEKTWFDSGVVVIHPLTWEKVLVWFADYVLPDYATGAVMFVPAHDERDFEFAKKYDIDIKDVITQHYIWSNKPVEWKKNTIREIVICILYNEDMSKVAVLDRKTTNYKSFVQWGVEENENPVNSGIREIIEETWFEDIEHIYTIPWQVHAEFYAAHKDVNRYAIAFGNAYKLKSSKNNNDIKDSEHHDLLWIDPSEVETFFGQVEWENDSLIFWKRYQSQNQAFTGKWKLINSWQFDWLDNINAKSKITEYLESIGKWRKKTTYRLRDRSVSRQRYRGSPIPVYYTFAENEQVPFFKLWNGFVDGKNIETRKNVACIVKHWSEDKYLFIREKDTGKITLAAGGIDEGEDGIIAWIREIAEETWYTSAKFIKNIISELHFAMHNPRKDVNRYGIVQVNYYELTDENQIDIEDQNTEMIWLLKDEVSNQLEPINQYCRNIYIWAEAKSEFADRYNAYNPHPNKSKWIPNLIPESDLPVVLPLDLPNYKPAGKSPLEDHPTFKYYKKIDNSFYNQKIKVILRIYDNIRNNISFSGWNTYLIWWLGAAAHVWFVYRNHDDLDIVIDNVSREEIRKIIISTWLNFVKEKEFIDVYSYEDIEVEVYTYESFKQDYKDIINISKDDLDNDIYNLYWTDVQTFTKNYSIKFKESLNNFKISQWKGRSKDQLDIDMLSWKSSQSDNSSDINNIYLRECDTLDTFMCSSFYYLRFLDPKNTEQLISPEAQKNMPVDLYIWGKEHTVGHLLYSRFIYKFLRDKWYISNPSKEPFRKLVHQGMVSAADGRKMSKRRWNVIDPMDTIRQYGADTLRTYIMFMWPIELNKNRNPEAVAGISKFLERVRRASDFVDKWDVLTSENQIKSFTHIAIKWITEDLESLKFNTAISKLMILLNHIYDAWKVDKTNWENFLMLLSPFATELSQELRSKLGHDSQIAEQPRPEFKSEYISAMPTKLAIQINGKMRWIIEVEKWLSQDAALDLIKSSGEFDKYISWEIKKVIYVPEKICNLIIW